MHNVKKKGFTLIELIAVLVIMAIIALIATPLVMSIIRHAKLSADKRSIDAYGRSVELAIAGYLLDTGKFPTEVSQLTIEYSGNKVDCSTTQLKSDSSVYLAGCTVRGRSVEGYTYGEAEAVVYDAYSVGDTVTYNNIDFYVIKDSGAKEDTVTLLKAEPLTVDEVNLYGGVGTDNNHVNMYFPTNESFYQTASDYNDGTVGEMAYFTSADCYYVGRGSFIKNDCKAEYELSDIKYVVDNWKTNNTNASDVIDVRLISLLDLINGLGYEYYMENATMDGYRNSETINWLYNNSYSYWTMSQYSDTSDSVWVIDSSGRVFGNFEGHTYVTAAVRPVVELYKSALN